MMVTDGTLSVKRGVTHYMGVHVRQPSLGMSA
jgi:hypothetical protein